MSFAAAWITLLVILLTCNESYAGECEASSRKDRELNMNVSTARDELGHWVCTFAARREASKISSDIDVDVTLKFSDCQEKETVLVRGVLKESMGRKVDGRLSFHPNCGTNVAIINDGRTIKKLRDEEQYNGIAFTNRPLKANEVFEVKLERKISKFNSGMVIGVTTHDPKELSPLPIYIDKLESGTWFIGLDNVYVNGSLLKGKYVVDLKNQKVDDRLGVKRTEFGTLHFYINGVDQGAAASRVPADVFGLYEVRNDVVSATIVDPS